MKNGEVPFQVSKSYLHFAMPIFSLCIFEYIYWLTEFWKEMLSTYGDGLVQPHCSKHGQLQYTTQVLLPSEFEYLHGCRLQNLSEQPVAAFDHPQSEKVFFLCLNGTFCISVLPFVSCPVTGHYWEKSNSVTLRHGAPSSWACNQILSHFHLS